MERWTNTCLANIGRVLASLIVVQYVTASRVMAPSITPFPPPPRLQSRPREQGEEEDKKVIKKC